jgi:TonB-dependent receptor
LKRGLGVCYYPEQWDETLWASDAARMAEIGLTWVRIGEFAWSRMEPQPGQYDWGWLDRAIATLGAQGLKVVLGTPTATPPRWMLDRHPDMLAVDAKGQTRGFGSRRHYDFSHQGYRAECAKIVTQLAVRYGKNPHVCAWQTDNEYACHNTVHSYSSAARTAFQNWLAQRYQSIDALNRLIDFECDCVNGFGDFRTDAVSSLGENRSAEEQSTGFWVQADFDFDVGTMPVRGNFGVRHVKTDLTATGYTNFGTGSVPTTVETSYERTLPSANLSIEPIDDLLIRFAAAKTIARPGLPALTPGGTLDFNPPGFSINSGNPFLDPIESTNYDVSFEWYPYDEALFAVAFFQKDIETFVQRLRQLIPYSETGFPISLLPSGVTSADLFDTNTFLNTPGGELSGYEITAQTPFTFLPGPFNNLGGQLSYTSIESEVSYVLAATIGAGFVQAPLTGQSPKSISATLYYEDGPFQARLSAVSRDEYLTLVPAASGNDFEGKAELVNVDFSASYEVNDQFTLTFEAVNLTDQFDERWISSARQNNLNYEHTGREFVFGGRFKY